MAYILGFIIADGNVSKNLNTVRICIHKKDIALLHYVNSQFGSNSPIKYQRGYPYVQWNSNRLVKSLSLLGVLPNKRLTWDGLHRISDVPCDLISSLIRGFFDGDGWVCHTVGVNRKMFRSGFANKSLRFLQQIKNILPTSGGSLRARPTWFQLEFADRDSIKMRDFIYKNDGFSLDRKKLRFYSLGV